MLSEVSQKVCAVQEFRHTARSKDGVVSITASIPGATLSRWNHHFVLPMIPWNHEYDNSHYWAVRCCRYLCSIGFATIRFDHPGRGETTRTVELPHDENCVRTAEFAATWINERFSSPEISCVALRGGSYLSLRSVAQVMRVREFIFIEPLISRDEITRSDAIYERIERLSIPAVSVGDDLESNHCNPEPIPCGGVSRGTKTVTIVSCSSTMQSAVSKRARDMLIEAGWQTRCAHVKSKSFWLRLDPNPCYELCRRLGGLLTSPSTQRTDLASLLRVNSGENQVEAIDHRRWKGVEWEVEGNRIDGLFCNSNGMDNLHQYCVVLCSGYRTGKDGPNGLLRFIGESLANLGCQCLTFDYMGRGESTGDETLCMVDMVRTIESAVDFVRRQLRHDRICLLGICAGAEAAMRVGVRDASIERLVLASTPFPDGRFPARSRWGYLEKRIVEYMQRINSESLHRVLRGDIDWSGVCQTLMPKGLRRRTPRSSQISIPSSTQALMLWGQLDEQRQELLSFHMKRIKPTSHDRVSSQVIEGASHSFKELGGRRRLVSAVGDWLAADNLRTRITVNGKA